MTPKEKSIKLCQQFGLVGMESEQTQYYSFNLDISKKLALIMVDEVIQIVFEKNFETDYYWHKVDYWKEVKEEIQKISIP